MINEKDYGRISFRSDEYVLQSSFHTQSARGGSQVPRDSLSKTMYSKLITLGDESEKIEDNKKVAIIWKTEDNHFKGILITLNPLKKKIVIITTYLFKSKTSDKVLKNAEQRIILEKI